MPNTDILGEIHLDKQEKKAIWNAYKLDFKDQNRAFLSYPVFCALWTKAFPHVRIRVYKQVSGTFLSSVTLILIGLTILNVQENASSV